MNIQQRIVALNHLLELEQKCFKLIYIWQPIVTFWLILKLRSQYSGKQVIEQDYSGCYLKQPINVYIHITESSSRRSRTYWSHSA